MTICKRCVMDDSDPDHHVGADGVCDKCRKHDAEMATYKDFTLESIFNNLKDESTGDYDCVIGISGGADSSYVYHLAKTNKLKPYVIHFDNEWDKEVTTQNVRRLTEKWGDELHSIVADSGLFRRIQRAFFEAGLPDIEVPTDHAIRACLYEAAEENHCNFILSGMNLATESHAASKWTHGHRDWRYIKSVCESMGVDAQAMPHYTIMEDMRAVYNYTWVSPLNYIKYNRADAMAEMSEKYGYESYGGKHQESIITRFVHGYILPRRFHYDTRRSRLSAMICSGQMTREEALRMLSEPAYDRSLMEEDRLLVESRWSLTPKRFSEIMYSPLKTFKDYPSYASNPVYLPLRVLVKVMQQK